MKQSPSITTLQSNKCKEESDIKFIFQTMGKLWNEGVINNFKNLKASINETGTF